MANYLYNGIELPPLPSGSYPYWYINYFAIDYVEGNISISSYRLINSKYPLYKDGDNYFYTQTSDFAQYGVIDGVWEWSWSGDRDGDAVNTPVIWTNHDINYKDGTLYLAASNPVPVETTSTTPTNADYYIRKNGKWYKNKGGASGGTSGGGTSGGTGTTLPTPTTDDNGKFLRAVDGAYALVALTDVSVEGA